MTCPGFRYGDSTADKDLSLQAFKRVGHDHDVTQTMQARSGSLGRADSAELTRLNLWRERQALPGKGKVRKSSKMLFLHWLRE